MPTRWGLTVDTGAGPRRQWEVRGAGASSERISVWVWGDGGFGGCLV
jgi:hypothetical protein